MKKLKKVLALGLSLAVTSALLAGCKTTATTDTTDVTSKVDNSEDNKGQENQEDISLAEMNPEDVTGTLEVWTWAPAYWEQSIDDFNQVYPNVTVNITSMGWGDYLPKFETAKATGTDLPDIAIAESYWLGKFLTYDDLFVDLTTVGFDKSEFVDSVSDAIVDSTGRFIAVPENLGVGCIWYRKDLAKEYFGTDDAAELEKMFPTWESFIDAGETVKQKSDGKAFLLPCATDTIEALIASYKTSGKSYVDGNKLTIKENMREPFELLDKALINGYIGKFDGAALDAAWAAGETVFFPSVAWREGFIMSQDEEGAGRWGIMTPPEGPYFRGGNMEMIVDKKDPKQAELVALFIRHRLFTDEGVKVNIANGNISGVKDIQDRKLSNGVNEYYGTDPTLIFYDAIQNMPKAAYGPYDSLIEDTLKSFANDMQKGGLSASEAIDKSIEDILFKSDELE